jgi:anti-sigma B factor antagonist
MAKQPLEAAVRRLGNVAVVDLAGELDAFGEQPLSVAFAEALSNEPAAVVLNFSQVDYINSTGIALVVGLVARARRAGLALSVYGLSEHFSEIFHITRLADYLPVLPDEASALRVASAGD